MPALNNTHAILSSGVDDTLDSTIRSGEAMSGWQNFLGENDLATVYRSPHLFITLHNYVAPRAGVRGPCSVAINDGDASTGDNDVNLTLSAQPSSDGVPLTPTQMRFSVDGSTWLSLVPYATRGQHTFSPQVSYPEEQRFIYARFRTVLDGVTYESETVFDDIILAVVWDGQYIRIGTGDVTYTGIVNILYHATSSAGEVIHYRMRVNRKEWSGWTPVVLSPYRKRQKFLIEDFDLRHLGYGTHTIDIELRDENMNVIDVPLTVDVSYLEKPRQRYVEPRRVREKVRRGEGINISILPQQPATEWADGSIMNVTSSGVPGVWSPVIYDGFGVATPTKIFVPMQGRFMMSDDAGETWWERGIPEHGGVNWKTGTTIQMVSRDVGYWATAYPHDAGNNRWGFLRTTDGWQTVERFPIAVNGVTYYPMGIKAFEDGVVWMWATTSSAQSRVASGQRILRSTNGGETWELKFDATPHASSWVHDCGFDAVSSDVAVVNAVNYLLIDGHYKTRSRVFRTADGGDSWDVVIDYPAPEVWGNWSQVACDESRAIVFPWGYWSIGSEYYVPVAISNDGGETWVEERLPLDPMNDTPIWTACAAGSGRFFFGDCCIPGRIWVTTDGGESWDVFASAAPGSFRVFSSISAGNGTVCGGDSIHCAVFPGRTVPGGSVVEISRQSPAPRRIREKVRKLT